MKWLSRKLQNSRKKKKRQTKIVDYNHTILLTHFTIWLRKRSSFLISKTQYNNFLRTKIYTIQTVFCWVLVQIKSTRKICFNTEIIAWYRFFRRFVAYRNNDTIIYVFTTLRNAQPSPHLKQILQSVSFQALLRNMEVELWARILCKMLRWNAFPQHVRHYCSVEQWNNPANLSKKDLQWPGFAEVLDYVVGLQQTVNDEVCDG